MTRAPLPLLDDPATRRAVSTWTRDSALDGAVGAAWAHRVRALVRQNGAARTRLLDDPAAYPVPVLVRLVRELAAHLGALVPQTHRGNRISLIRNEQRDYAQPATRGHQTNAALGFHSDRCDLALLLYVRVAVSGGGLSVVSYDDAARDLAAADPTALEALYGDFPFDLRDERIFPEPLWHSRPVLWRTGHAVRGHYIRRFIDDSQRHADCPRLRPAQRRALDALDGVLAVARKDTAFQPVPGELLVLDNYRVMHAREEFTDTRGQTRLAIRAWVAPYDSEPLPDFLAPLAGAVAAGTFRGGVGRGRRYHALLGRALVPEAAR